MRGTLLAKLGVFGPALLIVVAGFVVAGKFIQPAPPDHFSIATGGPEGAYYAFAQDYRKILAPEGVRLDIVQTSGSVQNLALLRAGKVDAAFLQGGIGAGQPAGNLLSLGSLFFEPIWVFHRQGLSVPLLSDLAGRRIAVGGIGSGTRAVALPLLARNGVTAKTAQILEMGGTEAATALRQGRIDAAFYVGSAASPLIHDLLADRQIALMSFRRAEAYTRHYRFMSKVVLPEGMLDFRRDVPSTDKTLLAPAASMVVNDQLHPALRTLLLRAMTEVHRKGGLFERPGEFPSTKYVDFPLSSKAKRYIEDGPSFLDRYLPYWVADMIVRLSILLLPLVTLLIPLMRIVPPLYRWRMRARILHWYGDMGRIEVQARAATTPAEQAEALALLDEIDDEVSKVSVPTSYRDMYYTLRFHIDLVRNHLQHKMGDPEAPSEAPSEA